MRKIIGFLFITFIRLYQWLLSPFLGASCRYTPTCSEYARQAIKKHGPWKGGMMAIKRIGSCRPGGGCGYDPVP